MTCDGKVMSVTQLDVVALEHACGGDPAPDDRPWNLGAIWLAMTYDTVFRWRAGYNHPPASSAAVRKMRAQDNKRAYGVSRV